MTNKLFVLAIPPFGAMLIGTVEKANFEEWCANRKTLVLFNPQRLALTGPSAQPGVQNAQMTTIQIGPSYFGDTPQEKLYVANAAVEVIGEVDTSQVGDEFCTENNRLYQQYCHACKEWHLARSNLYAPSVADIANITRLPKKN